MAIKTRIHMQRKMKCENPPNKWSSSHERDSYTDTRTQNVCLFSDNNFLLQLPVHAKQYYTIFLLLDFYLLPDYG